MTWGEKKKAEEYRNSDHKNQNAKENLSQISSLDGSITCDLRLRKHSKKLVPSDDGETDKSRFALERREKGGTIIADWEVRFETNLFKIYYRQVSNFANETRKR